MVKINGHRVNCYGMPEAWDFLQATGAHIGGYSRKSEKDLITASRAHGVVRIRVDADRDWVDLQPQPQGDGKAELRIVTGTRPGQPQPFRDLRQAEHSLEQLLKAIERQQDAVLQTLQAVRLQLARP